MKRLTDRFNDLPLKSWETAELETQMTKPQACQQEVWQGAQSQGTCHQLVVPELTSI